MSAIYINGEPVVQSNFPEMTLAQYNDLPEAERPEFWIRTDASYDSIPGTYVTFNNEGTTIESTDVDGAIKEVDAKTKRIIGHNCKDITSYLTDGTLWKRIAGTDGFELFEDIFPGDIIDLGTAITAPGSSETGDSKIVVLELDPWNNYQLNKVSDKTGFYHHITVCPLTHFGQAKMNDTNTTVGGYAGSKMQTSILGTDVTTAGTISTQLYNILGSHLKKTTELLSNSINASGYNRLGTNSGCANNWAWNDIYACLMSEIEIYGSIVWSSSGYDTGNAKKQFMAFVNDEQLMLPQGTYFWLKDVVTSTGFAIANGSHGLAYCNDASGARYVRPRFTLA